MSLNNQLKRYVENSFTKPNTKIYHYTPHKEAIISSKCLKLSCHDDLNRNNNRELKKASELIRKQLLERKDIKLLSTFEKIISHGIKIYTASFCEMPNYAHALKKYGPDYITFKKKFLDNYNKNENLIVLSKVNYNPTQQTRIISKMFKLYYKNKDHKKDVILLTWLLTVMPLFKEEKDRSDKECRIVTAEILSSNTQELVTPQCPKEVKFELSDIIIS